MAGRIESPKTCMQAEREDGEYNRLFRLSAFLAKLEQMPVCLLCSSCGLT